MKRVTIRVESADNQPHRSDVFVETQRGDAWNREQVNTLGSDDGKVVERTFQLRANQRVVLQSDSRPAETFDPVQVASIRPEQQRNTDGVADPSLPQGQVPKENVQVIEQAMAREKRDAEIRGEVVDENGGTPVTNADANKKDATSRVTALAGSQDPGTGPRPAPTGNQETQRLPNQPNTNQPAPTTAPNKAADKPSTSVAQQGARSSKDV